MLAPPSTAMGLPLVLVVMAFSAEAECWLALALVMDVSRLIDTADLVVLTKGPAQALDSPEVQRAFLSGAGTVALAAYQWSRVTHQEIVQDDWALVEGPEVLDRVVWAIRAAR